MSVCSLCGSVGTLFHEDYNRYYTCENCMGIFMESEELPSANTEHKRYEEHENDVDDKGYQNFVSPIVNFIKSNYAQSAEGLDYGAGPGPVISKLLKDSGYKRIEKYDPFYHKDKAVLNQQYDFIICCEVIEHFHNPKFEFEKLVELLKPKGKLVCMTHLYDDDINFENWYYKNDPTHVFFYTKETIEYIAEQYEFQNYFRDKRLIVLEK